MSYSRWINSCWYTFSHVKNTEYPDGGFAAWLGPSENRPVYTNEQVKLMLAGDWSPMVDEITEEQKTKLRLPLLEYAWDEMRAWLFAEKYGYIEELVHEHKHLVPEVLTDDCFKQERGK